jgi:hypothetical protein
MKDVNIREIRNRLEHGDLAKIHAVTGISVRAIGEALNKGRRAGGNRDAVLGAAMDILASKGIGRELLISKAENLKLTTADTIPIPYRSRKKGKGFQGRYQGRSRGINPLFYVAGAIAAIFVFRKKIVALMDKQTA